MRVGDRRLRAAAVAGGARVRAGALGTDAQRAALVEARDRAAARADAEDVDGRAADGQAADDRLVALEDAAGTERDVRRRAAHVERDDAVEARRARQRERARDAAGGTGERRPDREPSRAAQG